VRHATHEARHFELTIAGCDLGLVRVQLNRGEVALDEMRLRWIAAELLADLVEIDNEPA
jgi:hypothetical protein